jgi:hypothetical protein
MNRTNESAAIASSWIRNGAAMGLAATLIYYGMALMPLPERLAQLMALVFPGLLLCGHVGLYHWFARQRPSALGQAALIFGIGAPVLVSAMLCAQMSMVSYMQRYYHPLEEAARQAQVNIWRAADSIQLGLDVAWDMFILPTILMFAVLAWRHLPLGRLMGSLGVIIGAGGLVFNIWTFPTPPIDVGLVDVGPFAMGWYAVFFLIVLVNRQLRPGRIEEPRSASTGARLQAG